MDTASEPVAAKIKRPPGRPRQPPKPKVLKPVKPKPQRCDQIKRILRPCLDVGTPYAFEVIRAIDDMIAAERKRSTDILEAMLDRYVANDESSDLIREAIGKIAA